MKKLIALLMAVGVMVSVCACGADKGDDAKKDETTVAETTTSVEEGKYVFKSSKEQKVYKNGTNYMILYLEGDKITGVDVVQTFKDEKIAESSLKVMQKNKDIKEKMEREGKYVITHCSEARVKGYAEEFKTEEAREKYFEGQGYVLVEKAPTDEETTVAPSAEAKTTKKAETTKAAK